MAGGGFWHRAEHLLEKNLLLVAVIVGLLLAIEEPGPARRLATFDPTGWLIALIFLMEGLRLHLGQLAHPVRFLKVIAWAVLLTALLYPALAFGAARLFGLQGDDLIGLVLICAMPCSLASATVIAEKAGGDMVVAMVLLVILNLLGLVTIPLNLKLWLGWCAEVAPGEIVWKLLLYLFLPVGLGIGAARVAPRLTRLVHPLLRIVPALCLGAIVYVSCARESTALAAVRFDEFLHLVLPALGVHLGMLGLAYSVGPRLVHLGRAVNRSASIISSIACRIE